MFKLTLNCIFEDNLKHYKCESPLTRLVVYLDSQVNPFCIWDSQTVQSNQSIKIDLYGTSPDPFNRLDVSSCKICFRSFRTLPNEFGRPCWMDFGCTVIPLNDLLIHQKESNCKITRISSLFKSPLKVHTTQTNDTKGYIYVMIEDIIHGDGNDKGVCDNTKNNLQQRVLVSNKLLQSYNNNSQPRYITDNIIDVIKNTTFICDNIVNADTSILKSVAIDTHCPCCADEALLNYPISSTMVRTNNLVNYKVENTVFTIKTVSNANSQQQQITPNEQKLAMNLITKTKEGLLYCLKELNQYMFNYKENNLRYPDWIQGAERINCPTYPSNVTFENSQTFLPYYAYLIDEPLSIQHQYWINALTIMYDRRHFKSSEDYIHYFYNHASLEKKAIHAMDMITQYAQLLEYISDQVIDSHTGDIERIELFGKAGFALADDCEGLSNLIRQTFDVFTLRSTFDKPKDKVAGLSLENVLYEMQLILKQYIPFLCIEGVACASAQNQHELKDDEEEEEGGEGEEDENNITADNNGRIKKEKKISVGGAHAAIKFIPIPIFKKWLSRSSPGHPLLKEDMCFKTTVNITDVDHSSRHKAPMCYLPRMCDKDTTIEIDFDPLELPILIGEGTGLLNSGGESDPACVYHRLMLYSLDGLRAAKKPLYQNKGTSTFYKLVLFCATPYFMHDYNIASFRVCRINKITGVIERGVLFSDFIWMKDDICLVPYNNNDDNNIESKNNSDLDFVLYDRKTREPYIDSIYKKEVTNTLKYAMNESLKTCMKAFPLNVLSKNPITTMNQFETCFNDNNSNGDNHVNLNTYKLLYGLYTRLSKTFIEYTGDKRERDEKMIFIYMDDYYINEKMCDTLFIKLKNHLCDFIFKHETHTHLISTWRLGFLFDCGKACQAVLSIIMKNK